LDVRSDAIFGDVELFMNRYAVARSVQLLGLVIAPMGIMAELNDQISLAASLLVGCIGAAIFGLGRSLQPEKP
jgi:hypothetical protein